MAATAYGDTTLIKHVDSGVIIIPLGQQTATLTNSFIRTDSIVVATVNGVDVTATTVRTTPGTGNCIFTLNAAATANVNVAYIIISN